MTVSGAGGGASGRPSKLTAGVHRRIVRSVGLGHSYAEAARCGGVSLDSVIRWRKQGREELAEGKRTRHARFCEQVEQAQDVQAEKYLEAIEASVLAPVIVTKTHIKENPDGTKLKEVYREERPADIKGAVWWLERRRPETFARIDKLEHLGKHDGAGPLTVRVLLVPTGDGAEKLAATDDAEKPTATETPPDEDSGEA